MLKLWNLDQPIPEAHGFFVVKVCGSKRRSILREHSQAVSVVLLLVKVSLS